VLKGKEKKALDKLDNQREKKTRLEMSCELRKHPVLGEKSICGPLIARLETRIKESSMYASEKLCDLVQCKR